MNTLFTTRLSHGPSWEWVVFYPFVGFMRQRVFRWPSGIHPIRIYALPKEEGGRHAPLPGTLAHALPGQGSTPQG